MVNSIGKYDSKYDSQIIRTGDWNFLVEYINVPNCRFELIFRASRDGFNGQAFHSKCDNKGPTLVIIKSKVH